MPASPSTPTSAVASLIVVHPSFQSKWPFVAAHLKSLWGGAIVLYVKSLATIYFDVTQVRRMIVLGMPLKPQELCRFFCLDEIGTDADVDGGILEIVTDSGPHMARVYVQPSEGFWGQSVAEFALALTLCGLRRIPQYHLNMVNTTMDFSGRQYVDDPGTLAGKRVRIAGLGNIGSRYASWCHMMGADVAAWDPLASEPCFHRSGARREWHLERLVKDAEIFAPMLPLTEQTRGLVNRSLVQSLPKGCMLVLCTRAGVVDMGAVRELVLQDKIALAADVFDLEPLPSDDPLLGRANVIHTPHIAGRTRHANEKFAEALAAQFKPPA